MSRRFAFTCVAALVCGGCMTKPKAGSMSDAPSSEMAGQIRASYKTTFPDARVGVVTAVLGDSPYALVGEVDTAASREGDVFSFLDAGETVVASGKVVKVEAGDLTVRFVPGKRAPLVGDVAVKF